MNEVPIMIRLISDETGESVNQLARIRVQNWLKNYRSETFCLSNNH